MTSDNSRHRKQSRFTRSEPISCLLPHALRPFIPQSRTLSCAAANDAKGQKPTFAP